MMVTIAAGGGITSFEQPKLTFLILQMRSSKEVKPEQYKHLTEY